MTKQDEPSAMRRKAGAGRPPPEIGRMTAGKVLRGAVAQAAEDVAGLAAVAGNVEEDRTTLAAFVAAAPDPALLGLIEGPAGRFGLMVLDPQVVAALIEVQTTGRVVPRPAELRRPTRTDAIMCADFVDRVLDLVDQRATEAELEIAPALAGYRYALPLAEARAIAMTLEDVPYRRFRCAVDLGRGAKAGVLELLLPFDPPGQNRRGGADAAAFAAAMRAQVMEVQAELKATLLRRRLSLAEVTALAVGSLIAVPRSALGRVTVETVDGTVVARGRLGQVDGKRAVRLTDGDIRGAGEATGVAPAGATFGAAGTAARPVLRLAPAAAGEGVAGSGDPGERDGSGDPGGFSTGDGPGGFGLPDGLGDGGDPGGLGDLGSLGDLGDLEALATLGTGSDGP